MSTRCSLCGKSVATFESHQCEFVTWTKPTPPAASWDPLPTLKNVMPELFDETPSEPAAVLQDGKNLAFTTPQLSESYRAVSIGQASADEFLIPVKVVSREELRKQYEHDPNCYLDGKPCIECREADEARDAGAIEARELTDDTGVAYEMGWDAAMRYVREGK